MDGSATTRAPAFAGVHRTAVSWSAIINLVISEPGRKITQGRSRQLIPERAASWPSRSVLLLSVAAVWVAIGSTSIGLGQQMGTVRGRVRSSAGEAVEGAVIRATAITFHRGRLQAREQPAAWTTTDAGGLYRLDGLAAGRYLITLSASVDATFQTNAQLPSLYPPNPLRPSAIALSSGQTLDLDLTATPLPPAKVSGQALRADGQPLGGAILMVPSERSGALGLPIRGAVISAGSHFEFSNVPPGEYVIQAIQMRRGPSTEGAVAMTFVQVDGMDIPNLVLRAKPGSTITGRLTYASDEPSPEGAFVITPARADFDQTLLQPEEMARGEVQSDFTFQLHAISGPRRLLLANAPAGWTLKAVIVNGKDVTDQPLSFGTAAESLTDVEIVVTKRTGEISGVAVDAQRQRLPNHTVLLFPIDRALWYPESRFFRSAIADPDGKFSVAGVSPGKYLAAVIPDSLMADDDSWQDPSALEMLAARSTPVTLGDGEHRTITLTR